MLDGTDVSDACAPFLTRLANRELSSATRCHSSSGVLSLKLILPRTIFRCDEIAAVAAAGFRPPNLCRLGLSGHPMKLPRPLRVLFVAIAVVVLGVGLRFGLPIYRQQRAVREIEQLGGFIVETSPLGPDWLREFIGEERLTPFDYVTGVTRTRPLSNLEAPEHE